MKSYFLWLLLAGMCMYSCNNAKKNKAPATVVIKYPKPENKFEGVAFANKKDLTCGMPLTAGVGDTAHYKEKIYGFCSKECKDEFLKNPKAYLAAK